MHGHGGPKMFAQWRQSWQKNTIEEGVQRHYAMAKAHLTWWITIWWKCNFSCTFEKMQSKTKAANSSLTFFPFCFLSLIEYYLCVKFQDTYQIINNCCTFDNEFWNQSICNIYQVDTIGENMKSWSHWWSLIHIMFFIYFSYNQRDCITHTTWFAGLRCTTFNECLVRCSLL
jgi:hypothetical protein